MSQPISKRWGRGRTRLWSDSEIEDILKRWDGGAAVNELCESYETHFDVIKKLLQRHGRTFERRMRRRENHSCWRGGQRINSYGYRMVILRDDDEVGHAMRNKGRGEYVLEHRLVVAHSIGRPLRADETVHHLNGDRLDNRPENLELRQGKHGSGAALCCAECGSRNLVPSVPEDVAA